MGFRMLAELCGDFSSEYIKKQIHLIPPVEVIARLDYLLNEANSKVILDVGATGQMSKELRKVAKVYYGIDKMPIKKKNCFQVDLDRAKKLPNIEGLELIIAGEVIEHVSNAGHFLDLIHHYELPVILTTPNAFANRSRTFLECGVENVNREHVAWYSYHTLKTLVERHKFKILEWFWYGGQPITANGLIFKMEPYEL